MESREIAIVNSTELVAGVNESTLESRAQDLKTFKDFLKNDLVDGIDFGKIPNVDKPCLFKAGFEKIQFYLGLSPRYTLIHREFTKVSVDEKTTRNFYSWEWSCALYYGETKVAEGVGCANTEERKYAYQYNSGKSTPDTLANTVMKIAKKRAMADAILNVGGISDMFLVDLEDDKTIQGLKVDKTTKVNRLTKDQIKTVYATLGALNLTTSDLNEALKEFGYADIKEVEPANNNAIMTKLKQIAKAKKGGAND